MPDKEEAGVVRLTLPVEMFFRKRTKLWVIGIPALDVWSQGCDEEEAWKHLVEVASIFFEDCREHGTLFEVLQDCGFSAKELLTKPTTKQGDSHLEIALPLRLVGRR